MKKNRQALFIYLYGALIVMMIFVLNNLPAHAADTLGGVQVTGGGTGLTVVSQGFFLVGSSTLHLTATSSIFVSTAGNIGIASTSPAYQFSVGSTSSTTVDIFSVDSSGNIYGGSGKPSVACASACAVDANAHDSSGIIYISGVQTSVTLTFYTAKPWAPHCTVTDNVTTGTYEGSTTPTQLVMSTAASLGTASIAYHCQQ